MIRTLLSTTASGFDSAVGKALLLRRPRRPGHADPEALRHDARMEALMELASVYDRPEHYAPTSPFFPKADAVTPTLSRVRAMRGQAGEVLDMQWASGFTPHLEDVRDKYLQHRKNKFGAARLFLHAGKARPAIILVHGYRFGQYPVEERIWPVQWLYERGLDVALFVLPFHGVRAEKGSPLFPGSDPRMTNEGFRQTALDLGALIRFLRDRGADAVGLMGMSLGGYTTSLLSTLDEQVAFAIPMIPLASIADIARGAGRFVGTPEEQHLQYEGLSRVHRVVSPFSRASKVPSDRMLVLAARGDQITPVDHASRLAAHFGAPLEVFHGGHLLQFGRAEAFRSVGRMLGRLGLFSSQ